MSKGTTLGPPKVQMLLFGKRFTVKDNFKNGGVKCTLLLASSLVFTQMTLRQCGNVIE